MTFTNLLPWFSILGIGILLFFQWKQRQNIRGTDVSILQKELAEKSKELTEVKKELEKEKEGKSTLSGQNKELYAQVTNLKAEKNSLIKENEKLQTQVTKTEAGREQKEKEHSQALQKLDEAKKSLEEERKRVIREDEERKKQELEERDRMWNEHEHVVVSQLTDLCAKPQLKFTTYDNTNLPDDFDGSIKPDFLIDFLGQYIIFDAKISRSDNFQNYIKTQVQSTVKKVKKELLKGKEEIKSVSYVYITDERGCYVGVLSLRELLLSKDDTKIRSIMVTNVFSIPPKASIKEIAHNLTKYNLFSIAVTNKNDKLLGVVMIDDIMRELFPEA